MLQLLTFPMPIHPTFILRFCSTMGMMSSNKPKQPLFRGAVGLIVIQWKEKCSLDQGASRLISSSQIVPVGFL